MHRIFICFCTHFGIQQKSASLAQMQLALREHGWADQIWMWLTNTYTPNIALKIAAEIEWRLAWLPSVLKEALLRVRLWGKKKAVNKHRNQIELNHVRSGNGNVLSCSIFPFFMLLFLFFIHRIMYVCMKCAFNRSYTHTQSDSVCVLNIEHWHYARNLRKIDKLNISYIHWMPNFLSQVRNRHVYRHRSAIFRNINIICGAYNMMVVGTHR